MKLLLVGHSHMNTLARAAQVLAAEGGEPAPVVLQLRAAGFRPPGQPEGAAAMGGPKRVAGVDREAIQHFLGRAAACDATVLCLNGNEHNLCGLLRGVSEDIEKRAARLRRSVGKSLEGWLDFLLPLVPGTVILVPPPPPIESEALIRERLRRLDDGTRFETPSARHAFWSLQREAIAGIGSQHGVQVLALPDSVFDVNGFLAAECIGEDATHGNEIYGRRVVESILARAVGTAGDAVEPVVAAAPPVPHPYRGLPAQAFWRDAVTEVAAAEIDPVTTPAFRVAPTDKVATAGSCFAQHIARWLQGSGFNHFVTEARDPASAGDPDYAFSALYGNIYTSRQLLQLFERAFGYFSPLEQAWERPDGSFCDPFRPRLRPQGYTSAAAVVEAAGRHLEAVRRMFCELDVLVFTLGLTECWASRLDGAVYPLAPGVAGGRFDPGRYRFHNLTVGEITADLDRFLGSLRVVNPAARVVLTVSPVPLVATASGTHVLIANARSKAVLRAAADEIAARHANVCYFPSYEIIAGVPGKLQYFEPDCRSVSPRGVAHVMGVFMRRMTEGAPGDPEAADCARDEALEALLEVECDEEILRRGA